MIALVRKKTVKSFSRWRFLFYLHAKPRAMKALLTLAIAFVFCGSVYAQTDSSYYAFLKMRDGTPVAGKVVSSDIVSITIIDFNLGQLTLNKTQIVKETDIRVNSSYCFSYFTGQQYCGKV